MKKCTRCGYAESDDAKFCSSCGNPTFTYEDPVQPQSTAYAPSSSSYSTAAADEPKRPIGMAILTFLFPYIGGYFLIKPDVSSGYRTFGIVWCIIAAASYAMNAFMYAGYDMAVTIACAIFGIGSLIPIIIYLLRAKTYKQDLENAARQKRAEDLLNSDLETFEDQEVKRIAERYQ